MPEEIGHDHLYGLAWNPMTLIEVLKNINGAGDGATGRNRRAVTDIRASCCRWRSPTPNSSTASRRCRPPAGSRRPRRSQALRGALAVAEDGLAAAVAELAPGTTEQAAHRRHAGGDGRRWGAAPRRPRTARGSRRRTTRGAWAGATAGSPTVTWWRSPPARWPTATSARWAAPGRSATSPGADALCTGARMTCGTGWSRRAGPGAPASDLLAAYEAAGEALPPMPVAHGLGLGFDPPVISPDLRADRRQPNAWNRAWCWRSPPTCGKQVSVRCSAAMPC